MNQPKAALLRGRNLKGGVFLSPENHFQSNSEIVKSGSVALTVIVTKFGKSKVSDGNPIIN